MAWTLGYFILWHNKNRIESQNILLEDVKIFLLRTFRSSMVEVTEILGKAKSKKKYALFFFFWKDSITV